MTASIIANTQLLEIMSINGADEDAGEIMRQNHYLRVNDLPETTYRNNTNHHESDMEK